MYELTLNEPMKFESTPKIKDFVFEIVTTGQRLKDLAAQGCDFGINIIGAEEKLNKGAIMFCIFMGKELACVHWAAANQEAINTLINKTCYKTDFSNNEAYLGWSETNPKYRRAGLSMYVILEKVRLLTTMGKTTGKCLVARNNVASRKAIIKCGGRIYGEGRYLKILSWKSWKEKPVVQQAGQTQST